MYLSSGGIECYRSVEAVKAKVIALYAVVLSNANHRRQNVCRGEANRICGWTAPLLKPFRGSPSRLRLSFCFSGIRLFYERVRSFDSCETVSRRHRLYIRNRAFCSPRNVPAISPNVNFAAEFPSVRTERVGTLIGEQSEKMNDLRVNKLSRSFICARRNRS